MEQNSSQKSEPILHRFEKIKKRIAENSLEGVILVPGPNLRYLTGVNSLLLERPFLCFVGKEGAPQLLAPKLESGPYLRSPLKIKVHVWDDAEGPSHAFQGVAAQVGLRGKWGVEGRVPFRFLDQILKYAHLELSDAEQILQTIREVKDPAEIQALQRSATILSKSFLRIPNMLKVGITELELARKISQVIYSNGAEYVSDVLVQSGEFAADPHHLPSARKLGRNESLVVDTGNTYAGYYSDITRTFIVGKSREFEDVYENVLACQEAAIKISKNGIAVGSIDEAARSYLRTKGLDRYFIHRTGHGLGLEVHEAPYIIPHGAEIVRASMVFTIEPGVYIRGKMGIRIEDDVLATEQGCRVMTRSLPKQFGWWK
jgi:Xaa-Pro dipeptidase